MATVVLVVHLRRPLAGEHARTSAAWLAERGHTVVMPEDDAATLGLTELGVGAADLPGAADLVVALGGDGTVLRAVRLATGRADRAGPAPAFPAGPAALAEGAPAPAGPAGLADAATDRGPAPTPVPVLGVNLGRLGFLAEVEPDELIPALERFLAGEGKVEDRMLLQVEIRRGPAITGEVLALNDAVVEKPRPGNAVHLSTSVGGRPWATYVGDGVIVATPTGSTAYSFSARGPILSPRLRAMVLTPLAPHMTFDRSLVVSGDEAVRVEVVDDRPAALTVDGRDQGVLRRGDAIVCRPAARAARFVAVGPRDFYGVLRAKLAGAGG